MIRIKLLLLNFLFLASLVDCESTLKALFVAHRHGDRTPVSCYATDPYMNASYWPDGFGQLTSTGKKRMYDVGRFLRKKYDGFLTDSIREAQVRSSDRDRCIESTQLVLNGAYPPKGHWIWDQEVQFNPVPVHTMPYYLDSMLYPSSKCQAASKENERILNSNYVKSINEKNKNLYKYLAVNCGEPVQDIIKCSYVYDSLMIERVHNYKIPAWASPSVLRQMKDCSTNSFELMGYTRKIQKYRSGVFFFDIVKQINSMISPKKEKKDKKFNPYDDQKKKLFVYSSHDSFITVVLSALQINNGLPPPFGATIIFELHRHNESGPSTDENHSIKIFYLNDTETNEAHLMKIPGCRDQDICTVAQFVAAIKDLLINPYDWNKVCKDDSLITETLKLSSVLPMLLFKTVSTYKKKNKQIVYELLPVA